MAASNTGQGTCLQNIEQQRARFVLEWINDKCQGKVSDKLKAAAENFPALVLMNGLGQAAAFYKSKGDEQQQLYELLSDWLKRPNQAYTGKNLLDGITQNDQCAYRQAQAEALAFLLWVKKLAKAYGAE